MPNARLIAQTRRLQIDAAEFDILAYADPRDPLVWLRGDVAAVGIGRVLTLRVTGPERFAQLQQQWQQLVANTRVHDAVELPGSGLIAFGRISFSSASAAVSELVVPRLVVQRHGNEYFLTEIARADQAAYDVCELPENPVPVAVGSWRGCEFAAADYARYAQNAERVLAALAQERVAKAVLARQISGYLPAQADLRLPLQRLAAKYQDCVTFAINGFLGASPETLARVHNGQLQARVLAGTAGRDTVDAAQDLALKNALLTDPVLRVEHEYAVRSVREALDPLLDALQISAKPFALQLPNVWHLASRVTGSLRPGRSIFELLAAMHPTAAVAGTPTAQAVQLLDTVEDFDRRYYAGAVGWITNAGCGEWVLGLRCAEVAPADAQGKRKVTASAGGGLVRGSKIAKEYAETELKFLPIMEAFV